MTTGDHIQGLLVDLQTITETARAGIISRRDEVLEPGETRPAAILFVDIVGFTPLARKLSSEILTKVVDRAFRIFELTVRAHGGYCDKVLGDAALYVFAGHPNYPPVCEAALKAALKLQDRIAQINESLGATAVRLAIRQGVAFGEVTRQAVGAELAQLTVLGDTVNHAQRLQAAAEPDTIQTTIRVLEKAGDAFTRVKRGQLELKGIGAVTTYRLTGVEQPAVQLRGAYRQLSPLTGREMELELAGAQLEAWLGTRYPPASWDSVEGAQRLAGRNRLLILRGVPAVGKSRLAYEIATRAKARWGALVATAHCVEHASLAQFTAELARVADLNADNLPQRWEQLCARAAQVVTPQYAQRQRQHLRLLANVLGCRALDAEALSFVDPLSFTVNCQLALRACCELAALEHAAGPLPVILVVEDLQWLGLLRPLLTDLLVNSCLPQPLIVLGTARAEYAPGVSELCELTGCDPAAPPDTPPWHILELSPLSRIQGAALLEALLPGLELPPQLVDELHEKAAGVPYFYEDFARMLVRKKLVVAAPVAGQPARTCRSQAPAATTRPVERWQLAADLSTLDVPEDIQALMIGRLDQLDVELRELARRASVLGRSFQRELLAAIEQRLGFAGEGHPELGLRDLVAKRLLVSDADDRYFYEHLLLREAAYRSLLSVNRRLLHSIAADILSSLRVQGTAGELQLLEQVALHLAASDQHAAAHERICEVLSLRAGTLSLDGWDVWVSRAVHTWNLEHPAAPTAGGGVVHAANVTAAELLPSAALQLAFSELRFRQGRTAESFAYAERSLACARQQHDYPAEVAAHAKLTILSYLTGDFATARRGFEQSLEFARELGNRRAESRALHNLGNLHKNQGRMDEALSCLEQSLAIDCELGDLHSKSVTLTSLGNLQVMHGRMAQAQECFDEALAICRNLAFRRGESLALLSLGNLLQQSGRLAEARACSEAALEIAREQADRRGQGSVLVSLSQHFRSDGQPAAAEQCLLEALQHLRAAADRRYEAITLHNLGCVYSEMGELEQAVARQLEALPIADALGAKFIRGMCLASLGRYYAWLGMLDKALMALEEGTELVASVQDTYQLCHIYGSRVYYHLACGGYLPASIRQTCASAVQLAPVAPAAEVIENAVAALAQAGRYRQQLNAGPDSDAWREHCRLRDEIRDFARGSANEAQAAELLAVSVPELC